MITLFAVPPVGLCVILILIPVVLMLADFNQTSNVTIPAAADLTRQTMSLYIQLPTASRTENPVLILVILVRPVSVVMNDLHSLACLSAFGTHAGIAIDRMRSLRHTFAARVADLPMAGIIIQPFTTDDMAIVTHHIRRSAGFAKASCAFDPMSRLVCNTAAAVTNYPVSRFTIHPPSRRTVLCIGKFDITISATAADARRAVKPVILNLPKRSAILAVVSMI